MYNILYNIMYRFLWWLLSTFIIILYINIIMNDYIVSYSIYVSAFHCAVVVYVYEQNIYKQNTQYIHSYTSFYLLSILVYVLDNKFCCIHLF